MSGVPQLPSLLATCGREEGGNGGEGNGREGHMWEPGKSMSRDHSEWRKNEDPERV